MDSDKLSPESDDEAKIEREIEERRQKLERIRKKKADQKGSNEAGFISNISQQVFAEPEKQALDAVRVTLPVSDSLGPDKPQSKMPLPLLNEHEHVPVTTHGCEDSETKVVVKRIGE